MIGIYREVAAGTYVAYSEYGASDGLLPIITTHDGVLGEVVETKLYIRNNNPSEYYTDITVVPVCLSSPDEVDGITTGHGVKLRLETVVGEQPTEAEWEATDYGNTVILDDLGAPGTGDTSTYSVVWLRVECPAGTSADNKENIVIRIYSTAHPV